MHDRRFTVALIGGCLCVCSNGNNRPEPAAPVPPSIVTFLTTAGEVPVGVEVADNPASRARGLMYRQSLEPNSGMVFVFQTEAEHTFWMKNTYILLDMIFVNAEKKVVGVVANAEPLTEDARTVGVPSKYVVEVNGGFAAVHGVVAGIDAAFTNVPDSATR